MSSTQSPWLDRVTTHIGGRGTVKDIGKDAGVSALFAIGGYLTDDKNGPLKDASLETKRVLNAAFGVPMFARLTGKELVEQWKEMRTPEGKAAIPDFIMHALTATIGVLGVTNNDKEMITSAAMLATLFGMAGRLEEGVTAKSQANVHALEESIPKEVERRIKGTNKYEKIHANNIEEGEIFRVKAGEVIPVDGTLHEIHGEGGKMLKLGEVTPPTVLSGERIPLPVVLEKKITQGAIPTSDMLIKAGPTKYEDGTVLRISKQLEVGEKNAAHLDHHVTNKIGTIYVPIMLAACAGQFALAYSDDKHKHEMADQKNQPRLLKKLKSVRKQEDKGWEKHGKLHSMDHAVQRTAELAIKMAPCALVASTLVLPFIKNALAGEHGIIVRDNAALDNLRNVTHVLSDIRGTLTKGISKLEGMHVLDGGKIVACEGTMNTKLLEKIGKAQQKSSHALADSFRTAAAEKDISVRIKEGAEKSIQHVGGVEGQFADKSRILVGNSDMIKREGGGAVPKALLDHAANHHDVTYFHHVHADGKVQWGYTHFKDELREGAAKAIKDLQAANKKVVFVTGMERQSAQHFLKQFENPESIELLYKQSPEQKVAAVKRYATGKNVVAAIGDAENDSLFLQAARDSRGVSMAIDNGHPSAISASSMVIKGINQVPDMVKLSKGMTNAMWLNTTAAGAWMALLVGSHCFGHHMKPQQASVAHELPTLVLTLASLAQSMKLVGNMSSLARA